eukprot:14887-Heterococcus_DN1.PRE.6
MLLLVLCHMYDRYERRAAVHQLTALHAACEASFLKDLQWTADCRGPLELEKAELQLKLEKLAETEKALVAQQKATVAALTVVTPVSVTAVSGGTGDAPRSGSAKSVLGRPISASSTAPVITVEDAAARQELNAAIKEASHFGYACRHCKTGLYWTRKYIRQHHIRRACHDTITVDGSNARFQWLEAEALLLDRVQQHCETKYVQFDRVSVSHDALAAVPDGPEYRFHKKWLTDQIERAGQQRITLDLEQGKSLFIAHNDNLLSDAVVGIGDSVTVQCCS